jgi:hypothetical protein
MAAPTVTFLYNSSGTDTPYTGAGAADANFDIININNDKLIFTGGGIDDSILTTPTCASGTRSPTIRPSVSSYVIPETYVENTTLMYHCPLPGQNANRYCMCVNVSGTASSIMYLEAWDDSTLSTTSLPVLQGSAASGNESYVNAIRTTGGAPDPVWTGSYTGGAYLRGENDRVALDTTSPIINKPLYFNIYIRLETDSSTFHNTPVLACRYLYT